MSNLRLEHSRSRVFCAPLPFVRLASRLLAPLVHDVVLTDEELSGLVTNLLASNQLPTGRTSLREWLRGNADGIGITYASEIERHYRSTK